MIEKFTDLGLEEKDKEEQIDLKIQDKLGISLMDLKQALSASVQEKADEIVTDLINIVPFGDYDKLTEDPVEMAKFLREEAHKPEHWDINYIELTENGLVKFMFFCTAIDEGDTFQGLVFVSKSGKIRHAFAQGNN